MAIVIHRTPWAYRPRGSVGINRHHWAATGLRHLWLFSPERDFARDIVTGVTLVNNGTTGGINQNGLTVLGETSDGNSWWRCELPEGRMPPITILVGRKYITGGVSWSLMHPTANWTGYYGQISAVQLKTTDNSINKLSFFLPQRSPTLN